jgi:hypothetical protein
MSDFFKLTPQAIRENNARVRSTASPAQLSLIAEVDAAFEKEARTLDAQFDADAKLRAQAADLLGFDVSITEIELLNAAVKEAERGTQFWFSPGRGRSVLLYKTHSGTVDRIDRYVYTLEKALIDLTLKQDSVMVPISRPHEDQFTRLTFFDLIKMAFTRLFKRSTNGR